MPCSGEGEFHFFRPIWTVMVKEFHPGTSCLMRLKVIILFN